MKYIPMLWLIGEAFGSVFSIWVFTKVGYRLTFTTTLILFVVSQVWSAYIENYWIFIIMYALIGGIAQGFCVILPLYCTWRYFEPKHKALISGIKLSAFALAPIPMSFIAIFIINPEDIEEPLSKNGEDVYFPKEVSDNVPKFILTFSIGFFLVGILSVALITDPLPVTPEEDIEKKKNQILKMMDQMN